MAGGTPKKFEATTVWTDKEWDWDLYQRVEEHLRQTVVLDGTEQKVTIDFKDQQSTLDVATLKDAEARIDQEGTHPQEAYVGLDAGGYYHGRTAGFRVSYGYAYGEKGWNCRVSWSYPSDIDVRAAKASFDTWLQQQREQRARTPTTVQAGSVSAAVPVPAAGPKESWWKPNLRNVRDNLVANAIWVVGGLGLVGLFGWLLSRH